MKTIGNKSLLELPSHGFLCSRKAKSTAILPCLDWAAEKCNGKKPIISTFHSELESAVLDILIKGSCPLILVLGRRLYKSIPDRLRTALESGRLLIVSLTEQPRIDRNSSLACNQFICQTASTLTFGYLSESSSLYKLSEERTSKGMAIEVLDGRHSCLVQDASLFVAKPTTAPPGRHARTTFPNKQAGIRFNQMPASILKMLAKRVPINGGTNGCQ